VKAQLLLLLAAASAASPAAAEPPERTASVVVYGDDPCPRSSDEEIVVCARKPETERYRIPKELRGKGDPPSETSWGSRSEALEDISRSNLPGSCSVVGSYGQTGCRQQMVDQWYRERRANRRD
jgi:hypothetical protein